jgi:membrane protease YdiL (CAAX protease family)
MRAFTQTPAIDAAASSEKLGVAGPRTDNRFGKDASPVFDWLSACQLAVVFLGTQFLARWCVDSMASALNSEVLTEAGLFADQIAVAVFPIAWLLRLEPDERQIFRGERLSLAAIVAIVVLALPFTCLINFFSLLPPFTWGLPTLAASDPGRYSTIIGLIASVLLCPVIDEIFFRGILGRKLVRRYGPISGMVITSGIFAVTRLTYYQVVPAFLIGMACHVFYLSLRSLYAPILLHASMNCFGPFADVDWMRSDFLLQLSALVAVSAVGSSLVIRGIRMRRLSAPPGAGELRLGPAIARNGAKLGLPAFRGQAAQWLTLVTAAPFYALVVTRIRLDAFR